MCDNVILLPSSFCVLYMSVSESLCKEYILVEMYDGEIGRTPLHLTLCGKTKEVECLVRALLLNVLKYLKF